MSKLPRAFFTHTDTLKISQSLLGKYIVTRTDTGEITSGKIVETEAYLAPEDKASHAYGHRLTPRTQPLFATGGIAYIYLCYGIHHLFNIVTGPENLPHAVLIRAIEPADGLEIMQKRRNHPKNPYRLGAGPAVLTASLGISTKDNQTCLQSHRIWLEDRGVQVSPKAICAKNRIGIDYAGEYAKKPWRFFLHPNPWVSHQ